MSPEFTIMGHLPNTYKCGLRMRRECREHFPRHRGLASPTFITSSVKHVSWCMPGSLTSGFLWSRWWGKRSRHSRRMRNPQFFVSGKRPIELDFFYIYHAGPVSHFKVTGCDRMTEHRYSMSICWVESGKTKCFYNTIRHQMTPTQNAGNDIRCLRMTNHTFNRPDTILARFPLQTFAPLSRL